MNFALRTAAIAIPLACCSAPLLAQQPRDRSIPPAALQFPADRALTDVAADGTIWAAGERWKASFAAAGVTFVPYLGSGLPSQPVTFRLAAATIGGSDLPCGHPAAALTDQRVDFARGALVESYLLSADGIEQTFRFDALPARGTIALDIAVETALAYEPDGDGSAFVRAEGGVRYGRATAIDGKGRQLPLTTQWTGAGLRIVVPEAFVATAALPLVIDPLIGTKTTLAPSLPALSQADMAYDHSLGQYFACYERAYSATDHDVYVAFFSQTMQFQSLLTIDFTTTYWSKPRIAGLEGDDAGCVVAETSLGNVSPISIQARRFAAGPAPTASAAFLLADGTLNDRRDPDIGGDSSPAANSRFLVVWEALSSSANNSDLNSALFDATGANIFTGPSLASGIGFKRRPRISKTCGTPGGATEGWAIVHRCEPYQQTTGELRVQFINRNGTLRWPTPSSFVALTTTTPNAGSDWDVSEPSDHTAGRWHLCAERRYNSANGSTSIVAILFDGNGVAPFGVQPVASGSLDKQNPRAACDGLRFAVSYDQVYSATDTDIRVQTFHNEQGLLVQDDFCYATTSYEVERGNALCAAHGRPNEYGLAWLRDSGSSCYFEAQVYRGVAQGGILRRFTGCGNLNIAASGQPALGETVTFALSGANGLTGFLVGTPGTWTIAACPGCLQGANGTTLVATALPVAIPPNASFLGITLAVQGFEFLPSGQPCLGQVALSDTLDMHLQ